MQLEVCWCFNKLNFHPTVRLSMESLMTTFDASHALLRDYRYLASLATSRSV